MKQLKYIIVLIIQILLLLPNSYAIGKSNAIIHRYQGRLIFNIDKNWKFHEGRLMGAEKLTYNDSVWTIVNIPHDWRIHDQYNKNNIDMNGYLPRGIGWYRKRLDINPDDSISDIYVDFQGVFRNCTVWINGKKAGFHHSGYTGFVLNITNLIDFHSDNNVMAVLVDDLGNLPKVGKMQKNAKIGTVSGQEGWWYEGYGIYRHVNLVKVNKIHISTWGTFVHTKKITQNQAWVETELEVTNHYKNPVDVILNTTLFDPKGKQAATVVSRCEIDGMSATHVYQDAIVIHPKLWSPESPNLYKAITTVSYRNAIVDKYTTVFGIRWFKFSANHGFFLNGKHLELQGMNLHQDFGGLGWALPDRANIKDVEIAKQMGCNIIRSAHNDASPALLNACDSIGMLVWMETRYLDTTYYAISSLRDMIHRDRNHPSIICWSLANSGGNNDMGLTRSLQMLNDVAKKEDPSRPTAFACEADGNPNKSGFAFVTDIMGYNGGGMGRDDRDHALFPQRKMLISEYSSGRGTRGIYKQENVGHMLDTLGDGRIVTRSANFLSIYDLCLSHEEEWRHVARRQYLAGGIMWSGIEYLGESYSGWPIVSSQFGVLDMARFKKDAYYFYLQEWTHKPMVHIFPHWNWKIGDTINVWGYSNCDKVELFLNGKSLGIKKRVPFGHMAWKIPFYPGTILAKGIDNDSVVVETKVRTAGLASKLSMSTDRPVIKADGNDICFVTINVCDKEGTLVPIANNIIEIEVTNGKLLGLCSGNPMSHDDPSTNTMNAFNGKLLAIIQSSNTPGEIIIKARSENLKTTSILVKAK